MQIIPRSYLPLICLLTALQSQAAGKLKVFILAGQSNMEGHAKIDTFDYVGDDPKSAHLLKQMRGKNGEPRICDNTWISYFTGRRDENGEGIGKLTAGYGSRPNPVESGGKIGPEFTFGITMDKAFEEPVLIIKTAWGGKSLYHDFRSPSSGVYQRTEQDIEKKRFTEERSGHYYRLMIGHVRKVLSNPIRVVPGYDGSGYELAGFVWFQGWNDMVNRNVYPVPSRDSKANRYSNYGKWMANFIRDVRNDLKAPNMPFVIGVMGVGGKNNERQSDFRDAMASPTKLKEFKGNVAAVQTSEFWSDELGAIDAKRNQIRQMSYYIRKQHKNGPNVDGKMTQAEKRKFMADYEKEIISEKEAAIWKRGASNAGYHYLGCAKTFALMGEAFANTILSMRE
ncbi:MAG: hypothetical protein CMO80_05340 [Verrucomicrobiales bacterium]|nr:hypothetical protein [Verrucomicrobiales bacterium]|tara:strand:+ start:10366 stop:11553 length:1188 start_codon:yes stop_codon:yes gene_type:complete